MLLQIGKRRAPIRVSKDDQSNNCRIAILTDFKIEFLRLKHLKATYCYSNNRSIGQNINKFKIHAGWNNSKGAKLNYPSILYINTT